MDVIFIDLADHAAAPGHPGNSGSIEVQEVKVLSIQKTVLQLKQQVSFQQMKILQSNI
ncbi:hypothetical protein [Acinetobacter sp. BSP-28]|uniref:hypothetical protein n=1 Tax=Acinetobacter sp. BSP-28 TaxID=3344661 RepID=UPI0037702FBC